MANFLLDDDELDNMPAPDVMDDMPSDRELSRRQNLMAQLQDLRNKESESIDEEIEDNAEEMMPEESEAPEMVEPQIQMPLAAPAPQPQLAPSEPGDFQRILAQRQDQLRKLALLRASTEIGQALVGGRTGNFKIDNSGIDALEKMANVPVEDYSLRQKAEKGDIGLRDEREMRNSKSMISQFFREMARKRGMEVTDDMSAWDIQNMGKVLGKPNTMSGKMQLTRRTNPQTGKTEIGVFNPATGTFEWTGENAGYAGQVRLDPRTNEMVTFQPGTAELTGQLTGPKTLNPTTPQETFQSLAPKDQKRVEDAKKELNKETTEVRDALDSVSLLKQKVVEATRNPVAAKQIGAEIGKFIEHGSRMTDQDVVRYVSREGLANKMEDFKNRATTGTFGKELAQQIMATIVNYEQGYKAILENRRQQKAQTLSNFMQTPVGKADQLNQLLGEGDQPPTGNPNEVRRRTQDGKIAIFDAKTKKFLRYEE